MVPATDTKRSAGSQTKVYEAPTLSDIRPRLLLLVPTDALVAAISLYLAHLAQHRAETRWFTLWEGGLWSDPSYTILLAVSIPVTIATLYTAGAYRWWSLRGTIGTITVLANAIVATVVALIAVALVLRDDAFWRDLVFIYATFVFTGALLIRLVIRRVLRMIYSRARWMRHTIVVGTGGSSRAIAEFLDARPHLGFKVVGHVADQGEEGYVEPRITTLGTIEDLPSLVDGGVVDAVVVGAPQRPSPLWQNTVTLLSEVGTPLHVVRSAAAEAPAGRRAGDVFGQSFVTMTTAPTMHGTLAVKRVVDIAGAVLGLVLTAPLMLLTAAAIKLTSAGPALFSQERVGLHGRRFRMWKFRSMETDAEAQRPGLAEHNEAEGPVFKIADDPRITPVGKLIRRSSIDELPQLWNVLVGDMSLVGPRPPLPDEVAKYDRWQRRRLAMRPGLTCLWQVSGRSALGFDTWMRLDMEYIDNWSLGLDVRILVRTIPAVLTARGAK